MFILSKLENFYTRLLNVSLKYPISKEFEGKIKTFNKHLFNYLLCQKLAAVCRKYSFKTEVR